MRLLGRAYLDIRPHANMSKYLVRVALGVRSCDRKLMHTLWQSRNRCNIKGLCGSEFSTIVQQMRSCSTQSATRNIGVMAHIDAGKTTTVERMLYYSGFHNHIGEVHDGDTVMDYMTQERERGITITSAAISFDWTVAGSKEPTHINLIDTPGHIDFTIEVERALRVLDGVVSVYDGVAGVEAQSINVWRQASRYNVPRIGFVNKMDREGADMPRTIDMMIAKLAANPLVLHLPIFTGNQVFTGIIDLVSMMTVHFEGEEGDDVVKKPLGKDHEQYKDAVEARGVLIEKLCDLDDDFMDMVLNGNPDDPLVVDAERIHQALRTATISHTGTPVLCGSALKNMGVQLVLDAAARYLPSPLEAEPPALASENACDEDIIVKSDPDANLCALAFKVIHDHRLGPMVFFRVYAGTMNAKEAVDNTSRKCKEQVKRLMKVHANKYTDVSSVTAGEIAIAVGLKETMSGDTLIKLTAANVVPPKRNMNTGGGAKILAPHFAYKLKGLSVPSPVFMCTLEAESTKDDAALDVVLAQFQREDPSFHVHVDAESGERVLSGMGELHLEILHDRIRTEHNLETEMGRIRVSYKETVTAPAKHSYSWEGQIGSKKMAANVSLTLEPLFEDSDANANQIVIALPEESPLLSSSTKESANVEALTKALNNAFTRGALLGLSLANIKVTIIDASLSAVSTEVALQAATAQCVREALKLAQPALLEPVMALEVTLDEPDVGLVISELTAQRRAHIGDIELRDNTRVVHAEVPLSSMIGYSTALRSLTGGRAAMSMLFKRYSLMSNVEQKAVIKQELGF